MNQSRSLSDGKLPADDNLMNLINHAVQSAFQDSVQDTVDSELLLIVNGDGFKRRINDLIDARLHALAEEITVRISGAGPGRGRKGKTHRKISLSLPEHLLVKARELEGFFSGHVAAALELYLKLQKR